MKKVSVIVPCYNQAQFLPEALESVLKQTYSDWECVIVNDGSIDNTTLIAKEWQKKDNRFSYIEINNGGISNARNVGIKIAKGEYILPLDADDKIDSNYIKLAIEEFVKDSTIKLVYCKAEKFGNEKGVWSLGKFSLYNLARTNMIFCSALYRKIEWEAVGGYDVRMIHGLEDWEFWIALLKNGGNVKQIEEIGFYYRIKPNSRNKNFDEKQKEELFRYMNIKHAVFYVEQYGSFKAIENKLNKIRYKYNTITKSKKQVFNLFCKAFFGFKIFKS